ncbi:MAG: phage integrase N-terminal SAM-like domain-containing protein [Chthoniobacterales bacterium]
MITSPQNESTIHSQRAGSPIASGGRPRLLEQISAATRTRHYSRRTEQAYVHRTRRFILFHGKRHPLELGEAEVSQMTRGCQKASVVWRICLDHHQATSGFVIKLRRTCSGAVDARLVHGFGMQFVC